MFIAMDDNAERSETKSMAGSMQPWLSRVYIIDDHRFFSYALTSLINTQADLTVCGVGHDEAAAISGIIRTSPDVVVLDLRVNQQDGVKMAEAVRKLSKSVPILFVSSMQNPSHGQAAKWLEPCSFVEKTQDPVDIIHGIRNTLARFRLFQSLHPTNRYPQSRET